MATDKTENGGAAISQETLTSTDSQSNETMNNSASHELSVKLSQARESVQEHVNECERCPNELMLLRKAERNLMTVIAQYQLNILHFFMQWAHKKVQTRWNFMFL